MMTARTYQHLASTLLTVVASVFWLIGSAGSACGQENEALTADSPSNTTASQLYVALHEGQLTVDLQEANLSEVLAQIGQRADIPRVVGLDNHTRVSAQFTGVPLEHGLRRLLQRGGLSHAILYTKTATGGAHIVEVRVFGGIGRGAPPLLSSSPRDEEEARQVAQEPDPDDLREVLTAASSIGEEERDAVAAHLQGLLPWVAHERFEGLHSVVPSEPSESDGMEPAGEMLAQPTDTLTPQDTGNLVYDRATSK